MVAEMSKSISEGDEAIVVNLGGEGGREGREGEREGGREGGREGRRGRSIIT